MIKISNEVKVGAVALVTIVAFIWLYNFLKGKDYFKSTSNYYAVFEKVGGLAESSPVEINGYKVGVVQSIDFVDETSGKLLVNFSVNKGFRLPKNTVAEIVPVSVIAGMKVQFVYGEGPGFYSPGDTIPGRLVESLLVTFERDFIPIKQKMQSILDHLDSVMISVNDMMGREFTDDLKSTVKHLNGASGSLENVLGTSEKDLREIIGNLENFSKMLAENSGKMKKTFSNLESISDTIASADIHNTIVNLKSSLEKTSTLLENINDGKGTAGQLMTNDSLYRNLNTTIISLNKLLDDLKANPKRYVHFSVFGRKNIPSN